VRADQTWKIRFLLGVACCIAGVFFVWKLVEQSALWWRARSWTTCDARIEDVSLRIYRGSESAKREVHCCYTYSIRGHSYRGTRVGLASGPDGLGNEQQRRFEVLQDARSRGVVVPCFVNPDDPKEVVLFRELRVGLLGVKLVLAVVFFGGGLMLIFLVRGHANGLECGRD